MRSREKLAGVLIWVIALGAWCCIFGFGVVANLTDPGMWWTILLPAVVAPSICPGFLRWGWRCQPGD